MRPLAVSLIALVAAVPALADEVLTPAPVVAATVFPDGAEMTRTATVELPAGDHIVLLPYAINSYEDLPRIAASEGVTITGLGLRPDSPVDPETLLSPAQAMAREALEAAEEALASAKDTVASGETEVAALTARLDFLAKTTPAEDADPAALLAMADMLQSETASASAALVTAQAGLRPARAALDEARDARDAAEAALDRLTPPEATTDLVAVALTTEAAGEVTLSLTQSTWDAQWGMDYDVSLDSATGTVSIDRNILVSQSTGEPWDNIALTLSTARPGEDTAPQAVWPDKAEIYEPADFGLLASPVPEMAMRMAEDAVMEPVMVETAASPMPDVSTWGYALAYGYPQPVSLASGDGAQLAFDTLDLGAEVTIEANPRSDDTAFTVARLTNSTGEPILPGGANILYDGALIGRTMLSEIPAGDEATLGFGPVEGVRVATILPRNDTGDTGILSRSNTRDQQVLLEVRNLTGEDKEVRVIYALPFSEQEDLKVKVTAAPMWDETDLDNKRGVSAWDVALAAGETRVITLDMSFSWPDGQELSWHP